MPGETAVERKLNWQLSPYANKNFDRQGLGPNQGPFSREMPIKCMPPNNWLRMKLRQRLVAKWRNFQTRKILLECFVHRCIVFTVIVWFDVCNIVFVMTHLVCFDLICRLSFLPSQLHCMIFSFQKPISILTCGSETTSSNYSVALTTAINIHNFIMALITCSC